MVHVTKENFLSQLSDFLHHLPSASYIAIDEEMTGELYIFILLRERYVFVCLFVCSLFVCMFVMFDKLC